jgi:hypothetical protein
MDKVRSMIQLGCGDEESRLTGSLVAKYGNGAGNAAMRALKQAAERRFFGSIESRNRPATGSNFSERTAEGWDIRRTNDGGCYALAIRSGGMMVGQVGTMIERANGAEVIRFVLIGSAAREVDQNLGSFTVSASRYVRGTFIHLNENLRVASGPFDDGLFYSVPMTDSLATELSDAESIQFFLPSGRTQVPATFPVRGLAGARNAVQHCAAR